MNYLMKSWFLLQFPEDSGCGKVFHGRSRGNERYFPKRLSQKSPFKGREIHLEKRGIKGKYFCGTSAFSQVPSGEEPGKARGWGAPVPRKGRKGEKEPRDPRKNWLQRGWDLGKIVNKFIQLMNFAFPGRGNPGVSPGDPKCPHECPSGVPRSVPGVPQVILSVPSRSSSVPGDPECPHECPQSVLGDPG